MAGFEQNKSNFDQFTSNGGRPRVNLPAVSAQRGAAPPSHYLTASAEPNALSLNNLFPSMPAAPQVNLPTRQSHARYPTNTPHSVDTQNDLEGHLRGMILSNGIPDGPTPLQNVSNGSQGPKQRASKKPNQAQRRQKTAHVSGNVQSSQTASGQPIGRVSRTPHSSQGLQPSQGPDTQYQLPHLRSVPPQSSQSGNYDGYQGNRNFLTQRQLPGYNMGSGSPNQDFWTRNQPYNRPPPTNQQLYNPNPYAMQSQHVNPSQYQSSRPTRDAQIRYIEGLAHVEIRKAEISREEFLEKQMLRQSLEQVCRRAVSEYEMQKIKDAVFVPDSVELRCFGSLNTTFATKSSDMDLVLVSPMSKPETSSPDSELPRLIEKTLLNLGYGARLLTRTRVPIIRFCEKPTPELADLLLAERTKYEKERDAPPKIEPQTAAKGKEGNTKSQMTPKGKEGGPQKPGTPLSQDKTNDVAVNEAFVEAKGINIAQCDDNQARNVSEIAKIPGLATSETAQTKLETPSPNNNEGQAKNQIHDREGDDPNLAEKSDVERARLYRLAIQDGWYEPTERVVIKRFLSALEKHGVQNFKETLCNKPGNQPSNGGDPTSKDHDQLEEARKALQDLPNILGRYRPPPAAHPLDFPKDGVGIQCDINFSNHLALHNSHLLKCYSSCDPRVREMVLFVKAWSKKRKINSPYHGTLSSYGYVLMVLHYLANVTNPAVVPNLQVSKLKLQDEMSAKEVSLDGYNIYFFRNEEKILEFARRGQITNNREPLGSLLQGFFHYFAHQSASGGFAWTHDTLSLRTIGGIIPKQVKGWTGAKTDTIDLSGPGSQTKEIRQRYLFAIEDPFETDHNIARTVVHNGIVAIRDEFRRAHTLIQNAGSYPGKGPEDLFAEADEKENLQYRPFGPRPRREMPHDQNGTKKVAGPVSGHKDGRPGTGKTVVKDAKPKDGGIAGSSPN